MIPKNIKKYSYVVGLIILFLSHIYMLIKPMDQQDLTLHAIGNLIAGVLIIVSYKKVM